MRARQVALFAFTVMFAVAASGGLVRGPSVPVEFWDATLGDVNGDGLTDFLHGRFMLVNQGNGIFARIDLGLPASDFVADTLDVNGDGRSDFLVSDRTSAPPNMQAAPNTWSLYIVGEQLQKGPRIELGQVRPYVGDMNGDGKDDIVLIDPVFGDNREHLSMKVTVLISRGDGTFAARQSFHIPRNPQNLLGTRRIKLADLNRDGIRDIVMRVEEGLITLLGTGNGDFAAPVVRYFPEQLFGGGVGDTEIGDVDGDGHIDIVTAAPLVVRVFFGDGTGRFLRTTRVTVPRVRNDVPPPNRFVDLDARAPDLALGQFVHSGRAEIAAALMDGDVVVLAYENNKLREVARTATEFVGARAYVGAFSKPGRSDVYLSASIWNNGWRTPALFYVSDELSAAARSTIGGRVRAVRGFASGPPTKFDVQVTGGSCVTTSFESWSLTREGVWGSYRTPGKVVELAHEGDFMAVRFTAPWATTPVEAYLERKGNSYTGVTYANTACVSSRIEVTVTPR